MIERVAAAIHKACPFVCVNWGDEAAKAEHAKTYGPTGTVYLGMARAAISAMREPTDTIERFGCYQAEECRDDPCSKAGLHVWHAMLDTALTAHPHPEAECPEPPPES